ncbi:hypothetical protein EC988_005548 [Linderina pennispora]|nr:hypothetical protein EC988_005548 [Linderina pennispora]
MPFDPNEELFTDADPGYRNTRLESTVPPPSLSALSRSIRSVRGGTRAPNRGDHSNNSSSQRSMVPGLRQPPQPAPVRPEIDVKGSSCIVISNSYPPSFAEQHLCSPDWIRMMSDRDDARGRRGDARLGDVAMMQSIQACKQALAEADSVATTEDRLNVYSCLKVISPFVDISALKLAHLDYPLGVVREYLQPDRELKFVDLCSGRGGFTEYILWRASKQLVGCNGWYFADKSSKQPLDVDRMLPECHAAQNTTVFQADILDPANVDAFIQKVRGDIRASHAVDLVVAEGCTASPSLDMEQERQQYAYLIAQAAVGLKLLRKKGTFVFKAFDTFTPLSAEILFILHTFFERTAIVRSLASSPSSAERFVVCNRLITEDTSRIVAHLMSALHRMHHNQLKLAHLVSWTRVSGDKKFMAPLYDANMKHAASQLQALNAILAHMKHPDMVINWAHSPQEVADVCFEKWGIPKRHAE